MTTEKLEAKVANIIETLPDLSRTAFEIGVTPNTLQNMRRRLPQQIYTLNALLRSVGKELAIVKVSDN